MMMIRREAGANLYNNILLILKNLLSLNVNFCFAYPLLFYFFFFSSPHQPNKKKVSDVNDDVRRAAVTGIGFLLFR